MSVMYRLLNWMGLVDEGESRFDPGYQPGSENTATGRRPPQRGHFRLVEDESPPMPADRRIAEPVPPYYRPSVVPPSGFSDVIIRSPEPVVTTTNYTEVLEASTFDDVRKVADRLREQVPVIVNLRDMEPDQIRRLVDFLSGLVYALDGTVKKSAPGVLLARPPRVEIAPEELRRLSSLGLYDRDL
ncbi:MAG: cell division protein SepF [bacterium]|nr:cell division protein SepF [bacterium]MCY3652630.1 cell division protein SepF [bacterium]